MSADLLRRAAEKLRAAVHEDHVFVAPWRAPGDGTVCDPEGVIVDGVETPEAEYIALMHPPVALALADWLGSAARDAEEIGPDPYALAVARAILREEGPDATSPEPGRPCKLADWCVVTGPHDAWGCALPTSPEPGPEGGV